MEKREGNLSREMERRLQNQTQEIWLHIWLYVCTHMHSHELIQEKLKKFNCISYTSCYCDKSPEKLLTEEVYLVPWSKGLVSYGGEDIAKERALVCSDRSISLLTHICLNKERKVNAFCLVLFFPYLFCLGTQPMRCWHANTRLGTQLILCGNSLTDIPKDVLHYWPMHFLMHPCW